MTDKQTKVLGTDLYAGLVASLVKLSLPCISHIISMNWCYLEVAAKVGVLDNMEVVPGKVGAG